MAPPSPYPGTLKAESFANWQAAILLFIVAFLGFWLSPIPQVQDTDAKYALLVSHRLLTSGQMNLDPFFPEGAGQKDDWRIERAGSHLYYFFPPGTSFLSLPFVAVGKLLGRSIVSPEGKYLFQVEQQLQTAIAAVLMAFLVAIFFLTARLVLPLSWSCIVALGAGFGTQVWSTMSRGLWSDTWGALLIGIALLILMAQEVQGRRMNPVLLGTLLAWSYIVRPTYSIHIAAITVYVWLFHRRLIIRLVLTGACWLVVFVTYSWIHFHTFLPSYYSPGRIKFDGFGVTLAGNLISPSRGLLCHVPVVLLVAGLVIYYWRELRGQWLVGLAGIVVAGHLIVHSSPQGSLGGGCFGARYTSGLVPWFVLCAVLALDAMRRSSSRLPRLALATGAFLLALGVGINGRGAMARETWSWNSDFDLHPWKMWDWKHPQFLAGLQPPPLPPAVQPPEGRIDFAGSEVEKFLWFGWSRPEQTFRWNDGRKAGIVFSAELRRPVSVSFEMSPFLVQPEPAAQRVRIAFQGKVIHTLTLDQHSPGNYSITLPRGMMRQQNKLTFALPDATAPKAVHLSDDPRLLAIQIRSMEFHFEDTAQPRGSF